MRFDAELEQQLIEQVRAEPDAHLLLGTAAPRLGVEPYTIHDGTVMVHRGGHTERLHRVLYRLLVDPRLGSRRLRRACTVWGCANPRHWQPARGREPFARDAAGVNLRKRVCPQGHRYTAENTYLWTDKRGREHRACRTCRRARLAMSVHGVVASDKSPTPGKETHDHDRHHYPAGPRAVLRRDDLAG